MNNINIKKSGNIVGIIVAVFFSFCVAWGLVLVDPVLIELHLNILKITFPGFAWSTFGIIVGFIEAYIYGWIFGALFAWLCRKVCISE